MKIKTYSDGHGDLGQRMCDWTNTTKGVVPVELYFDEEGLDNILEKLLAEGYHIKRLSN